ncbi:hypothetical protein ZOD2009_19128 [Haladaptatus paucihalophilus DX253]|nr:hypothetical protein ZOD2009_19128 [Haladaptatus paucihalophilus DX253]
MEGTSGTAATDGARTTATEGAPTSSPSTATSTPGLTIEKSDLDFIVNVVQLLVLLLILARVGQ